MFCFRKIKACVSSKIYVKVLMTLLLSLCTICVYSSLRTPAVCYAKTDNDKEKVEDFATAYYEAHTAENMELLPDYIEDSDKAALEMIALEECLKSGVEKYDNIDVVVYPLSDGISWLAYATYDLVVKDFNVEIPGSDALVVRKQSDGSYKILGDIFGNIVGSEIANLDAEIHELYKSDEIVNIYEDVNDRYQTILTENSDIAEWIAELGDEIFQAQWKWVQVKDANMYQTEQNEAYVVREGDCLWSIAEEQLGDGMYWSSIYEANRELIGDDPNLIYVGWELMIDVDTDSTDTRAVEF